jgi:hypothetical protein
MARQVHTAQTPLGSYPSLPIASNGADITEVAAIVADKEQVAIVDGKTLVLAHNTDSGAHTVTFTSVPDPNNRTGDISAYSIGAGEIAMFGPFRSQGWAQTDGKLYFEANDATVKFAVLRLP